MAPQNPEGLLTRREYEAKHGEMWREINRLKEILEGPPHPGLESKVSSHLIESQTEEKQRDKQHAANRWRLDFIIAALAALAAWLVFFKH